MPLVHHLRLTLTSIRGVRLSRAHQLYYCADMPVFNIPPIARRRYRYRPLDSEAGSIRLLRVLSKRSRSGLPKCELIHADVDSSYTCLSYVWGQPNPSGWIEVDGRAFRVRQNLLGFLEQASIRFPERLFWIDALCINQSNVKETNSQVQQMDKIFLKAHGVIAWLGTDKNIEKFIRSPQADGGRYYAFWNSEYWNRAWVTQELALAGRVTLMAGASTLRVSALLQHAGVNLGDERFLALKADSEALSRWKSQSLLDLLALFRFKECERPSDSIFSLLGLCGQGSDLVVDYDSPPVRLLSQVLAGCPQSSCWCSLLMLLKRLRIGADYIEDMGMRWPDAQFQIQTRALEMESSILPSSMDLELTFLCDQFDSDMRLRLAVIGDRGSPPGPELGRLCGECGIHFNASDSVIKVSMSIITMINLSVASTRFRNRWNDGRHGDLSELCSDPKPRVWILDHKSKGFVSRATVTVYDSRYPEDRLLRSA
jgi:hypothetical protein